jgi:hypothetical protein
MRSSDHAAVRAQPFLSSVVTPGRAHRQDLRDEIAAGLLRHQMLDGYIIHT